MSEQPQQNMDRIIDIGEVRMIDDPYLVYGKTITMNGLSEDEAHGRNVWGLSGEFLGIYNGGGKVRVRGGLFNGEIQP